MKRQRPWAVVVISTSLTDTKYKPPSIEPRPTPDLIDDVKLDRSDRRASFALDFRDDAIRAVDRLTRDFLRGYVDAEEAASVLLPYLIKASPAQQNLVFNAIMDFATPQDLLYAALAGYRRNPRILRVASDLLEHYGEGASPVLGRLARSGRPECRYFVGAILRLPVSQGEKLNALDALAKFGDADTRRELLDEADRASSEEATLICRLLTSDADEQIRESASDKLACV